MRLKAPRVYGKCFPPVLLLKKGSWLGIISSYETYEIISKYVWISNHKFSYRRNTVFANFCIMSFLTQRLPSQKAHEKFNTRHSWRSPTLSFSGSLVPKDMIILLHWLMFTQLLSWPVGPFKPSLLQFCRVWDTEIFGAELWYSQLPQALLFILSEVLGFY